MTLEFTHADRMALERAVCADSLAEFQKRAWHVIEPSIPWKHNWHTDCICEHLEAAAKGELDGPGVIFNVAPGTSKSSTLNIFFNAWLWGPFGWPEARIIGASHEATLATRDSRRTRMIVESAWFQERWPIDMMPDQNEKTFFENRDTGWRVACPVKSMTGRRGDFVNWDDPLNPEKAFSDLDRETANRVFDETLPSRLNDPVKSKIFILMQRLHEDDVTGHALEKELGYHHVVLPTEFEEQRRCYSVVRPRYLDSEPVLARYHHDSGHWYTEEEIESGSVSPEMDKTLSRLDVKTVYNQDPRTEEGELLFEARFPREVVERDRKAMGSYGFAGQHQQEPFPRGGTLFSREDFRTLAAIPAGTRFCRGWDLAATETAGAARTAGVKLGIAPDSRVVIAHVAKGRFSPRGVKNILKLTAQADGAGVIGSLPQDPGSAGKAYAESLVCDQEGLMGYPYTYSTESGDKTTRAMSLAAQVEAGNVYLVEDEGDPWVKDFVDEAVKFPSGKFKDQVDAASRALTELTSAKIAAIL